MKRTTDAELKRLIKNNGFYKVEEMYVMGWIKLSGKQIDYLLEEKRKYNEKQKKVKNETLFVSI